MTSEVPYDFTMIGTSNGGNNTLVNDEVINNNELIHDNNTNSVSNIVGRNNTKDVISLLNYLVPGNSNEQMNNSNINNSNSNNINGGINNNLNNNTNNVSPPPQIADPTTLNELLGLISGVHQQNNSSLNNMNNTGQVVKSMGDNGIINHDHSHMTNSIPYLLPLLMGSGQNNDQNNALLNSMVNPNIHNTSNNNSNMGNNSNINQFVNQLQSLLPSNLVSGNNQNNSSNNSDHLQMLYNSGHDNKNELLAAAAAFAASNVNSMTGGPITGSRGRNRKRTSATPISGMRNRRDQTDMKRRGGSPSRHHNIDPSLLPHLSSMGSQSMDGLEHGTSMINTPSHANQVYADFSTEDARHSVRFENGLVLMTKRFIQYLYEQGESRIIDLAAAEAHMDVQRRRLYDITNVLEGIGILKKMGRNAFMCSSTVPEVLVERDKVLSSFGTVDMSVKISGVNDDTLNSIPWFRNYNKLQSLSSSEYEIMEKALIQRKEQLLQASQQLGFNDIIEQFTIASASVSHTASANVANYGSTYRSTRPSSNITGNITNPNPSGPHPLSRGLSLDDNNEQNETNNVNPPNLWGNTLINNTNRSNNVPSIHHPDARWMEAPADNSNHSNANHNDDNNNNNKQDSQSGPMGGFNE